MRRTLPRVLDNLAGGALVVSMFDHTVFYANPLALAFLPEAVPDAPMDDVIHAFARRYGLIRHPHQAAMRQITEDQPIVVEWLAIGRGLWLVATRMDEVQGFPPSAILTYHTGPNTDDERLEAVGEHMTTAFAARVAVQLDETASDIAMAMNLLTQSHQRTSTLTEALVELVTQYPTLGQGGLRLPQMAVDLTEETAANEAAIRAADSAAAQ